MSAGEDDDPAFSALLRRAFELPAPHAFGESVDLSRCSHCGATVRGRRALCPADGRPMQPAGDPRVGEVVAGSYRVLERLGGGGVGTVYRARHRTLGHEVAVKYLRPEFAHQFEHRARLEREARIMGRFHHEHVVGIVDYAVAPNGSPVLIMEYLSGETLAAAIVKAPFSQARAVHVARQIARALVRAHQLGVLHRDIKPSNVLLCRMGVDRDFVKLLDFGIARSPTTVGVTHSRDVVGTPHYMSPEQSECRPLGPASDLYSLGCVIFEMLAGRPPFDGSAAMVMHAHVHESPPALADAVPQAAPSLCEVVARLLLKSPKARYRDAHQLLLALDAVAARLPSTPAQGEAASGGEASPFAEAPAFSPAALFEDELERRLRERLGYLERAASEHFGGTVPAVIAEGLSGVASALQAVSSVRARLSEVIGDAEVRQAEPRARVERLGAALVVLSQDATREAEQAETLRTREAALVREQEAALALLARSTGESPASPREGERLSASRAGELAAVIAAAREAAARGELVSAARAATAVHDEQCQDLHFQIDQLKGRIAALEAEVRGEVDITHAEAATLEARYRSSLESAAAGLDALMQRWPERGAT